MEREIKDLMSFNGKLDEFYFEEHGLPTGNLPFTQFNPQSIIEGIRAKNNYPEGNLYRISERLLDIKYLYYCMEAALPIFYNGKAKIIGNGNIKDFGRPEMRFLQEIHYRVYIISSIYERILDFLELVYFSELTDPKKDKWGKRYKKLVTHKEFNIISEKNNLLFKEFKEKYRRGELHSVSTVLRRLYDNEGWYNFSNETNAIKKILAEIVNQFSLPI